MKVAVAVLVALAIFAALYVSFLNVPLIVLALSYGGLLLHERMTQQRSEPQPAEEPTS